MTADMRIFRSFISLGAFCALRCVAQSQAGTAPPTDQCTLSGYVTSLQGGLGLKHAKVSLSPVSSDADRAASVQMLALGYGSSAVQAKYSATSQADGFFCFERVLPGQYTLSGSRQGFLETNYGAVTPTDSGRVISVESEPPKKVLLALVPQAVVSGKITDEDDEPLIGASVSLLMRLPIGGQLRNVPVRGAQSNDIGEFRLANIAPGAYYVVAQPKAGAPTDTSVRRSLRTLYPGVAALPEATPIVVRTGEERSGVNIRLLAGQPHHIRGTLVGLAPTDQGSITIHPEDEEQVFITVGGANYKPDGTFDFANIDPGRYVLSYFQVSGDSAKGARRTVTVGDRDVNDVVISIASSPILSGSIKVEGDPPENAKPIDFQKLHLSLSSADSLVGPSARATVERNGKFTIRNIVPGRYILRADAPLNTYLKSIRDGQTDFRTRELDLTGGGLGELEILYRYGLATVTGMVEADESISARVLLVPRVLDAGGRGIIFGASDAAKAFVINNVPPGHYRAYAFESVDFAALQEPAVLKALQSAGMDLEIAEGDHTSITLRPTSPEDERQLIDRARAQQ